MIHCCAKSKKIRASFMLVHLFFDQKSKKLLFGLEIALCASD